MIHFVKEGQQYETGLNITIDRRTMKIFFIFPIPVFKYGIYEDWCKETLYKGLRVLFVKIGFRRFYNGKSDVFTFHSTFLPVGKQKVILCK